jgi:phosphoribosylanthranilate isomerase
MEKLFVKVCGLRLERDVDAAVEAGADAIGFVVAESPRLVDAGTAARLARRVPEHVLTVGVFRDQPVDEVRRLADLSGVRGIQLHGSEGPEHYSALRREGLTLIRATSHGEAAPRRGGLGDDLLLLDAPVPGSGTTWDWTVTGFAEPGERWILAGGLTPRNVREAVRSARPWGVDVSSGVESSRGVKDPALITAFVEAARSAR